MKCFCMDKEVNIENSALYSAQDADLEHILIQNTASVNVNDF